MPPSSFKIRKIQGILADWVESQDLDPRLLGHAARWLGVAAPAARCYASLDLTGTAVRRRLFRSALHDLRTLPPFLRARWNRNNSTFCVDMYASAPIKSFYTTTLDADGRPLCAICFADPVKYTIAATGTEVAVHGSAFL